MARKAGVPVFSIGAATGPIGSESNWTVKLVEYDGTLPKTGPGTKFPQGIEYVSLNADGMEFDDVITALRENGEVYPSLTHRVYNFKLPELFVRMHLKVESASSMFRDACREVRGTSPTLSLMGQLAVDIRQLMSGVPEDQTFTVTLNVQGNKRDYTGTHEDIPKPRGRAKK